MAQGDRFGYAVTGDVEVIVGAPNFDTTLADAGSGSAFSVSSGAQLLGSFAGTQENELAGWDVLGIGQFDGAGADDFAIGSRDFHSLPCGGAGSRARRASPTASA